MVGVGCFVLAGRCWLVGVGWLALVGWRWLVGVGWLVLVGWYWLVGVGWSVHRARVHEDDVISHASVVARATLCHVKKLFF